MYIYMYLPEALLNKNNYPSMNPSSAIVMNVKLGLMLSLKLNVSLKKQSQSERNMGAAQRKQAISNGQYVNLYS